MARIVVNFQHNRGLIYDADDYLRLRFEFRIVGNLVGVPVSHPRNINQNGLPVVLSIYEIMCLLKRDVVELVDKNADLLNAPYNEQIQLFNSMIEKQKEEMRQPIIEKRIEAFRKHLPKIIEGKTKKLLKLGLKIEDIDINAEQLLAEEVRRLQKEKFDVMVQIPTMHPFQTVSSRPQICLNTEETIKYRIFESLWNRGSYITVGDAFGCDFLLYPGDPIYFHASHMVHVLKNWRRKLDLKYLIRICRLSVVVNKFCVIAYIDESSKDVHFETLEWEGSGNKRESM